MPPRPLSPDDIRYPGLTRAPLGRRGYVAEEVDTLLGRIADEVTISNEQRMALAAENTRLKAALRDWASGNVEDARDAGGGAGAGLPGVGGGGVNSGDRLPSAGSGCQARNLIMTRLDSAQRSTRRMGDYIGGHYEQVAQAASDHHLGGHDPHGPEAVALSTWMSWAKAVLTEVDATQAQIMAARKVLDAGCAGAGVAAGVGEQADLTRRPASVHPIRRGSAARG